MADAVIEAIQLPADGAGKVTGGFLLRGTSVAEATVTIDSHDVYLPASVIVDSRGVEIGSKLLLALGRIEEHLEAIRESAELSTAALTS